MNATLVKLVVVLTISFSSFTELAADDTKDKAARAAREQARRVQQQVKTLEAEKGSLAADKAKLEGELKDAQAKAESVARKVGAAERARAELAKSIESMRAESTVLAGRLAEEERKRAEAERKIVETERRLAEQRLAFDAEKRRLEGISAQQIAALAASRERNERMYKMGFELIDRYENKPLWTSALQAEPFTGLKRAQIEKMAEDEREKFDKERLPPEN
jgi:chromosome segregation ATPase